MNLFIKFGSGLNEAQDNSNEIHSNEIRHAGKT